MSSVNRDASWTTVVLDAMWWLRPVFWAAIAAAVWVAVIAPAHADPFPFPPPNTGCPPNTSCIPGGGAGTGNPGQCTPNPNGNPGCNGAGNPVDIITGNKYQHEIDLAPLPGEMGLHFARHYNSNSTHRGLTGVGWRSTYEIVLVDLGSALQIIDADGRRLTFDRNSSQPSLCVGARPEDGRVIVDDATKNSGTPSKLSTYRWQRLDGSEYTFGGGSGDGHPLKSIRAASGATMTLNYLGGALDSVRDAQGRMLRFVYARPLAAGSTRHRMLALSAIDTPVGRISYKHDEFGRLQSTIQPNGLVHRYHYEPERQGAPHNTWALTGISVEFVENGAIKSERLATYVYDGQGRAVRTQHVGGDDLTLVYGPKAATTITTNLGARTVYRHAIVAGQWKTVEALGPGCGTCPPSNLRYRYRIDGPHAGQLESTLRLDAQGKPLQQERIALDAWGRTTRVEHISYINTKTLKQPQKPEMVLRAQYVAMPQNLQTTELTAAQYASLWRPALVARPSVVAGREHSIAFAYNAYLQPLTKTEAGFSPLGVEGTFAPTALTRTTTYRYAQIAGASRLTAVDGPLPGSTDTKTFHYDELGRLRFVQHPVADLQERFAYDDAGRVVWHTPPDAVAVQTRYPDSAQTLATQPLLPSSIERAGRATLYQFNNRGWVTHWTDAPHRSVSLIYNHEGRVIEARDAQGNRVTWNRDDAKQLEATLWFDADQANAADPAPERVYYRWFDHADRTVRTLVPDGRVGEYTYDTEGRLTQHFDGNGVAHLHLARRDSRGAQMQARIDWAPDNQVRMFMWGQAPRGSSAPSSSQAATQRRMRDDFGRIVRFDLPEHGTRVAQYDDANRVTRILFADGAKVEYQHDVAGRMSRKTVSDAHGVAESSVTFQFHGAYLIEVVDPAQRTAYRYDSAGRRIETRITLTTFAAVQTYVIGTVFDAQGEPVEHRLADGRTMTVERDATTRHPTALALKAHGLHPQQPIIRSITAHPFNGITGYTHGNGVVSARGYDNAGRLTALNTAGVLDLRYDYRTGPRIRAIRDAQTPAQSAAGVLDYDGFGALKTGTAAQRASISEPRMVPHSLVRTGLGERAQHEEVERDIRGRLLADGQFAYRYDALDRLISVHELASNRLIARYVYNAFGERVAKTTFDANGTPNHRMFLYQRSRLVAEVAVDHGTARVEHQYIYLNGEPVARIEPNRVLAIHNDHRGAPLAMTDSAQRVVWKATYQDAWGAVRTVDAPSVATAAWKALLHKASAGRFGETPHGATQLNLRLPGQYADEETGLHYNLHRYYDPRAGAGTARTRIQRVSFNSRGVHGQGRYLTPDPLGYPDGPDPYLYASGDPINKVDPLGLYESDVHYYMTFFLAVAAGMRAEDARMMALATQFIDDNRATKPNWLVPWDWDAHQDRLYKYHFVFTDPATGQLHAGANNAWLSDPKSRSPQLQALYGYAAPAPELGSCNYPSNQSLQFMGEYLHAFEDTFSHRNRQNMPYGVDGGVGHWASDGDHPDYTYNHGNWQVNENRTFTMEYEVYHEIRRYMLVMDFDLAGRTSGRRVEFDQLEAVLRNFNQYQADERHRPSAIGMTPPGPNGETFRGKIEILNAGLLSLGYTGIDMTTGTGVHRYVESDARRNRQRNFNGLNQGDYENAILRTP